MSGTVHRFEAVASGALIGPGEWTGEVQAVYARVVNVLRPDGLVVSLVADAASMTAMSVHVPSYFVGPPSNSAAGLSVDHRELLIDIADIVSVDLSRSRSWEGTIDEAIFSGIPTTRVSAIREALIMHGKADGLLGILYGKSTNPFVNAVRAALSARRLEALVGLGPGLTPAGDDFLTGALMASAHLQDMGRIEAALPRTTPGGRTLLWMALRRSFPAYLLAFVEAVAHSGSPGAIRNAVHAACSHGETSGSDSLTGFCWAMDFKR